MSAVSRERAGLFEPRALHRVHAQLHWRAGAPTHARPIAVLLPALLLAAGLGCGSEDASTEPGEPRYARLSETGLYADFAARALAPGVRGFAPTFELWSDGADKSRWIALPEGTQLDTSDMNHWSFPVGTRLWKEFALGGVQLETRLIERYGTGPDDYWMGSFVWQADGSDAVLSELGADNLHGTEHDAPARERCPACHNGEPGRVIGFSALQLAASPAGFDLAALVAEGWLTQPPADAARAIIAGDADSVAALGYLHANCGNCHNPRGAAWPDTQMLLRLDLDAAGVQTAPVLESLVGQRLQYYRAQDGEVTERVVPGEPQSSGLVARMRVRGPKEQMPPLATEQVDAAGVDLVSRWIASLPR
jgi:mono/diheme cytochrome c family protein